MAEKTTPDLSSEAVSLFIILYSLFDDELFAACTGVIADTDYSCSLSTICNLSLSHSCSLFTQSIIHLQYYEADLLKYRIHKCF